MPLSKEQAMALLKEDASKPKRGGSTKTDPTVVRSYQVWFKLNHHIREEGCDNPECVDTRPKQNDKGTNVVALVQGKYMCRYCFLAGWMQL